MKVPAAVLEVDVSAGGVRQCCFSTEYLAVFASSVWLVQSLLWYMWANQRSSHRQSHIWEIYGSSIEGEKEW